MTDLLDQLRAVDPAADRRGWSESSTADEIRSRIVPTMRPRRRWMPALAAAAVVLALVVGVLAVTIGSDSTTTKPTSAIYRLVHGKWRTLPRSPLGALATGQVLSTPEGVLVWGQLAAGDPGWRAALFHPDSGRWEAMPALPALSEPVAATGILAGDELVLWGHGYALDVAGRTWRRIPRPTVDVSEQTRVATDGKAVFVVNASGCTPERFCLVDVQNSAVLDLQTRTWAAIASPPTVPSVAALGAADGRVVYWTNAGLDPVSYQYDPATNAWVLLAETPSTGFSNLAASMAEVRQSVAWVAWGSGDPHDEMEMKGAVLESGGWRALASAPHPYICNPNAVPGPTGTVVVSCSSTETVLLDIVRDRWHAMPRAPHGIGTATWTGKDLYALSHHGRLMVLR